MVTVQSTYLARQGPCIQLGDPITGSRSSFKSSECEWSPGGHLPGLGGSYQDCTLGRYTGLAVPAKTMKADQRRQESKQAFLLQRD